MPKPDTIKPETAKIETEKKVRVKGKKRVAKKLTKKEIASKLPPSDTRGERRGGFYWPNGKNGKPYLSVTTALGVISKEALQWWSNKQVYWAMVADPGLSEKEALAAPYSKSKKAMFRGTDVHAAVEHYKHTGAYLKGLQEPVKTYIQAFYQWVLDNDIEVIGHERSVLSLKYGYAGTFDLLVRIRNTNRLLIVDIKTGKDVYKDVFLQLSAYRAALDEEGVFEKLGVKKEDVGIAVCNLQTGKDDLPTGKYQFLEGAEDMLGAFLAAKFLWEMRNEDKIMMINKNLPDEYHYIPLQAEFSIGKEVKK